MTSYEEDKSRELKEWVSIHRNLHNKFISKHFKYRNESLVYEAELYDKNSSVPWSEIKKNVDILHRLIIDPQEACSKMDNYRLFCKGHQKSTHVPDNFEHRIHRQKEYLLLKLYQSGKKFI